MPDYLEPLSISPSAWEALKHRAGRGDYYRFFDVRAEIRSDSQTVVEFFRQTYRHFLVADVLPGEEYHNYYIITDSGIHPDPILLWDKKRACSLLPGAALADSADVVIFGSLLRKIDTHFLVHGAALEHEGEAVILSGMSGSGKSTLALELTRRGFRFCSDEIAAISRGTHKIHPFPRAIGSRENTSELLRKIRFKPHWLHHTTSGEKKWIADIEDIFGDCIAGLCDGRYLILLETVHRDESSPQGYHNVRIALKRIDERLIEQLAGIEGVEYSGIEMDGTFPYAGFRVRKEGNVQRAFLDVCEAFNEIVLYRVKVVSARPDPGRIPVISRVSKMEAGLELLGNLQNMAINDGWMPKDPSVDTTQVLYELLDAIADVECYRLVVGNLEKTADLISKLAGLVSPEHHPES
jgi:hypothetical protein